MMKQPGIDPRIVAETPKRDPSNIALAPCRTKVFFERDVFLVWQPNPSIPNYALTFLGPDGIPQKDRIDGHFAKKVSENLLPGAQYFWQVKDRFNGDSYSPFGSARFSTLEKKKASEIAQLISQIQAVFPLDEKNADTSGLFLLFQLYHSADLHLDALMTLDELMWRGVITQDIRAWRRDLCRIMGIDETQIPYLQSPFKTKAAQKNGNE